MSLQVKRTSNLQAPVLLLTGHDNEVYSLEFSPDGNSLATAGNDAKILLFQVYGECINYGVLNGHKNAILEVHWTGKNGEYICSCSADHNAAVWDVEYRKRQCCFYGHTAIVNSCYPARQAAGFGLLVTGSDDGTVKVWDGRDKRAVSSIQHDYQILSVCTDPMGQRIFSGSLDNIIRVYDTRKSNIELFVLDGCGDCVTSLDLNSEGTLLLSNSMDQRLLVWDVEPMCLSGNRLKCCIFGPTHSAEKNLIRARWGKDTLISSGSADHMVYIIDSKDQRIIYQLPGHLGSVNEAVFHPIEPIIASASSDKCVYLGELA